MITKNQVKYIQSLGQKKWRDEENCFIAEGPKLVKELLEAQNCHLVQIYALKEWVDSARINAEVIEVSIDELQKTPKETLVKRQLCYALGMKVTHKKQKNYKQKI
jgi:TrmH family RNA methyltransferase